jgi:3-hydroxybutyryl-CoA dehydrogenase
MSIQKVGVLGLGTMGHGIAIVAAMAGFDIVGVEINKQILDSSMDRIRTFFDRSIQKGRMTEEEGKAALGRISGAVEMGKLAERDLIIEAAIEDLPLKCSLFAKLNAIAGPDTIFATNTSSLPVTEMASASGRPDRFIGLHFFNPVPVMKLVEVIRALQTSDKTYDAGFAFVESLGKKGVKTDDTPGFIVNRLLVPFLNDAARVYEQGLASAEDIDNAMKLGAGHPMGPLALIDLIGLDVAMWVGEILFKEFGEARMAPPPILRRMVRAGYLGKKSGRGFYEYGGNE